MDWDANASFDLPVELIEEILSRSPIKCVVRFKSVSKQWHAMISDPRFSRIHRIQRSKLSNMFVAWIRRTVDENRRLSRDICLMRLEDGKLTTISKFRRESEALFAPLCSCNGIFLVYAIRHYMLWNPSIQKSTKISAAAPGHGQPYRYHLYHDARSDDYKIVFVYEKQYTFYSCENRSWGKMVDLPGQVNQIFIRDGAFVDGCLYSMCNGEIVFFDVRDGKMDKFQLPKFNEEGEYFQIMAVSGRLCVYRIVDRRKVELWVMEKRNGSFEKFWRKISNMGNVVRKEMEYYSNWVSPPLCLSNEDIVVFPSMVHARGLLNLVIFNPRFKGFHQQIEYNWVRITSEFSQYQENLYMPT